MNEFRIYRIDLRKLASEEKYSVMNALKSFALTSAEEHNQYTGAAEYFQLVIKSPDGEFEKLFDDATKNIKHCTFTEIL